MDTEGDREHLMKSEKEGGREGRRERCVEKEREGVLEVGVVVVGCRCHQERVREREQDDKRLNQERLMCI